MAGVITSGSRAVDNDADDDDDDDSNRKKDGDVIQNIPKSDVDVNSPTALILLERWGSPIHGGIAAALYQLLDQLKSSGLTIHCTVLDANGTTEKEAERLGVTLVLPKRNALFKKEKPSYFWLSTHTTFYPHLKDIPNLKFIFGFGIVSSSVAVHIKDNVLPNAEYIHVNVWNQEELTHEMFPYDKEEFDYRRDCLYEQNQSAFVVLSIGPKTFDNFKHTIHNPSTKHLQLVPLPDEDYFDMPVPRNPPESHNFRIMTPFEENAISALNHLAVVPRAINIVAERYENRDSEPPKWEILCMNKHDDKEIMARLDPYSNLIVIIKGLQNNSFGKVLLHAHLVIIPPASINSLSVIVATIASGKPIVLPTASEGDYFIKKYFKCYRENVVVEMRKGPEALKAKIIHIIEHYALYMKIAKKMREMMKTTVMEEMKNTNSEFLGGWENI
ncbi:uncharacterized protein [Ptychodera flava]|uniref:uncharacterized protein n=1 Tax=Ptychodera flava TaxID=63121 RepID=UPI00396A345E